MITWWRRRRDPRIGDELRAHRDQLIDSYVAGGVDRQEAERRAFLEFGNVGAIEESVRDIRGRWLDDLVNDLNYSKRMLLRNPGFGVVTVLTLALGIGASTAIFSLVNAVLLRPLPVDDPDSLVQVTRFTESGSPGAVSYPLFEHFRENVPSVSVLFAQQTLELPVTIGGALEFVAADVVSGDYFNVLRLEPAAGRLLTPSDDLPQTSEPVAVITDGYWRRRFGGSPSALGAAIAIRDRMFTIVGVTPASFRGARFGRSPDLLLPLTAILSEQQRRSPTTNSLNVLARLRPGATPVQANVEAEVAFSAFMQPVLAEVPQERRGQFLRMRAGVVPSPDGINQLRYEMDRPLLILMGTVGLVLLLVCVNLSGVLLAKSVAREREISIRLAIGAGRSRLIRQLLTESLVIAVLGGACGLLLARWLSARLVMLFLGGGDFELQLALDWRVLAFASAVSFAACIATGLAPALQAVRVRLTPALKEARAHADSRLGRFLVTGQLAISMVLVVSATLFGGTLLELYSVDRGFESDGLLVANVRTAAPFPLARALAVQLSLLERLRMEPGVRSASATQVLPVGGNLWDRSVQIEGGSSSPEVVAFNVVAREYFATLGTPLIVGREFDDRDTGTSSPVAVVNDRFAQNFFGSGSAIGRRVTSVKVTYEIVGVVRDAKYQDLREPTRPTMYVPWTQLAAPPSAYSYLIRVDTGDPAQLTPTLHRLVREVDPALDIRRTSTYASIIDRSIPIERTLAALGGLFGLLGLTVAGVGVFGVLAFRVARRTNEIGVRMALGASGLNMICFVLKDVIQMLAYGIVLGAVCALTLTGLAGKILFGVTPHDPRVFVIATSVLVGAGLLAAWLPARRASRVDPLVALRHE